MSQDAADRDRNDILASLREEFQLPPETVYLNGNSLGPLSRTARARARQTMEQQWGQDLISSWNRHGWIDLPLACGEQLAPLLGAAPDQVICCDSISLNLFKLLAVALGLRPGRAVVLSTFDNFPTDLYAAQGLQALLGQARCQLQLVNDEELTEAISDEVAVVLASHVNFRSAHLIDIETVTAKAHARGALVIWDLAHSAGVMPLTLDDWEVDFAVGCGYKYLNGGPGAPAFIYAGKRHHQAMSQPLTGWMGHRAPFDFSPNYEAAPGTSQFLTGTPPILSMATLQGALEVFTGVTPAILRAKSRELGEFFQSLVAEQPALDALKLRSPRSGAQRGAHLAYAHPDAYAISRVLATRGVVTDFRSPDLLRIGFSPLILRFADIATAVDSLGEVMANQDYRQTDFQQRARVT